jgi:nucleotide-binding universal stress UspA family protein
VFDRILVPTDGGDAAHTAARRALDLAAVHDATVHALYVVETDTGWRTVSKAAVRDALREAGEDVGSEALAAIENLPAAAAVPLVTELREGTPDEEILGYVADEDVDLVVMGVHSRPGIGRRVLGHVTERVVRDSPVPVLTVAAAEAES